MRATWRALLQALAVGGTVAGASGRSFLPPAAQAVSAKVETVKALAAKVQDDDARIARMEMELKSMEKQRRQDAVAMVLASRPDAVAAKVVPKNAAAADVEKPSRAEKPVKVEEGKGALAPAVQNELQRRLPFYHTGDQIREEMRALAQSCEAAVVRMEQWPVADNRSSVVHSLDIITVRPLAASPAAVASASVRGRVLDADAVAAKEVASEDDGSQTGGLRAMLVFGEHARELISPESGLHFLRSLCEGSMLRLNVSEIKMVLNANPLGRRLVEGGDFCRRTNEDGVDLNRNWGDHFSAKVGSNETAPGPRAFSEPETRALRDIATQFQPGLFLTVHSGALLLGAPFGYSRDAPPAASEQMLRVLQPISEKYCQCPFGSLGRLIGYNSPGNSIDYAYEDLGIPFSFTWEIYADEVDAKYYHDSLTRAQARKKNQDAPLHQYTSKLHALMTDPPQKSKAKRARAHHKRKDGWKPDPLSKVKAFMAHHKSDPLRDSSTGWGTGAWQGEGRQGEVQAPGELPPAELRNLLQTPANASLHDGPPVLKDLLKVAPAELGELAPAELKNLLQTPANASSGLHDALLAPRHLTPDECLARWNPTSQEEYGALLEKWTAAYVDFLVLISGEVAAGGA